MSTLKVGGIQSATGNSAITLRNSGIGTFDKVPHVSRFTNDSSRAILAAQTDIAFPDLSTEYDISPNAAFTSFTINTAGKYMISMFFLSDQSLDTKIEARVNGVFSHVAFGSGSTSTYQSASAQRIMNLSANDILTFTTSNHDGRYYWAKHTGINVWMIGT